MAGEWFRGRKLTHHILDHAPRVTSSVMDSDMSRAFIWIHGTMAHHPEFRCVFMGVEVLSTTVIVIAAAVVCASVPLVFVHEDKCFVADKSLPRARSCNASVLAKNSGPTHHLLPHSFCNQSNPRGRGRLNKC